MTRISAVQLILAKNYKLKWDALNATQVNNCNNN